VDSTEGKLVSGRRHGFDGYVQKYESSPPHQRTSRKVIFPCYDPTRIENEAAAGLDLMEGGPLCMLDESLGNHSPGRPARLIL